MRRNFVIFMISVFISLPTLSAKAQENSSFMNNVFIEFGVSYSRYNKYVSSFLKETKYEGSTMLTPMIGYKFHPRWSAGVGVTFSVGEDRLYNPMPSLFVSYDFVKIRNFSVFAQLQGTYGTDRYDYDGGTPKYTDMWECGMRFGASYRISDHFSVNLRYLFIGYSRRASSDRYRGGVVGDNDFIMDAGLRPLQLSVRYTF